MGFYINDIEFKVLKILLQNTYCKRIGFLPIKIILEEGKLTIDEIELALYALNGKGFFKVFHSAGQLFPDSYINFLASDLMVSYLTT